MSAKPISSPESLMWHHCMKINYLSTHIFVTPYCESIFLQPNWCYNNKSFPGYNPVWVDQKFNIAKAGVCTYFKNYLLFKERNIW